MTTLYLVRHGQTESNAAGIIQGQHDSPLTQLGQDQAQAACQQLSTVDFQAAYSSDLGRAYHTAQIIAEPHHLSIATDERLRERNFGPYEGKVGFEIIPYYASVENLSGEERFYYKGHPSVESDKEVADRFMAALQQIAAEHDGETVLVVTHGGPIRIALYRLGYATYEMLGPGLFKNGGHVVITAENGDFQVQSVVGLANAS